MNKALINRRLRQLHLWFGVAIGAQIGLWLISGLFMTLFPIEQVRGDLLRAPQMASVIDSSTSILDPSELRALDGFELKSLTLKSLENQTVWYAQGEESALLLDARTGQTLSPIAENFALTLSNAAYGGSGTAEKITLFTKPPREYGRNGPVWQVQYSKPNAANFYIDATSGEVRAVRTGLWRTFDFMWGLHIMDWSTRENFNSWWIKMTASLAVIFFLTGLGLAVLRISASLKRQKIKKGT